MKVSTLIAGALACSGAASGLVIPGELRHPHLPELSDKQLEKLQRNALVNALVVKLNQSSTRQALQQKEPGNGENDTLPVDLADKIKQSLNGPTLPQKKPDNGKEGHFPAGLVNKVNQRFNAPTLPEKHGEMVVRHGLTHGQEQPSEDRYPWLTSPTSPTFVNKTDKSINSSALPQKHRETALRRDSLGQEEPPSKKESEEPLATDCPVQAEICPLYFQLQENKGHPSDPDYEDWQRALDSLVATFPKNKDDETVDKDERDLPELSGKPPREPTLIKGGCEGNGTSGRDCYVEPREHGSEEQTLPIIY